MFTHYFALKDPKYIKVSSKINMARYTIALATLLASNAYASEVSIDPNGAIDRSLFSKVRVIHLDLYIHEIVFHVYESLSHIRIRSCIDFFCYSSDSKLGGCSHEKVPRSVGCFKRTSCLR